MSAVTSRSPDTVARTLARWAIDLRAADIGEAVEQSVLLHLMDGLGCAVGAARLGLAQSAVTVAEGLGGPAEAGILGRRDRVAAPAAALANGTLLHAMDFDDTHAAALVHATACVLPTLLAVGQQTNADGAAALRAAVAGYEIVCRLGAASPHGFHARGLHATQVCGVLGAAAVAALLTGMDETGMTDAMGIAGSAAGGLLEFLNTGASTKQLHPGLAALNGILAARLAAAGATGPASVIEGDKGLYAALAARPVDVASITADLGGRWETTQIGLKPYPACQLMHAALDAGQVAIGDAPDPLDSRLIADVAVALHPDSVPIVAAPEASKVAPRSAYEAKFSVQWSLAALLIDGRVSIDTYGADSLARSEVSELAQKVHPVVEPATMPPADAPGQVVITLADGTELRGAVPASRGTTAMPMSAADVREKFLQNCGSGPAARELAAAVDELPRATSLDPLLALAAAVVEEGRTR